MTQLPHPPISPHVPYTTLFRSEPVPEELRGEAEARERASWKYQRYMRDYLRCVQAVDDSVGEILGRLEADGIDENTIVIYTSDQGFFLGDHGWFDKRLMLDESLTMPMLIRWPAQIVAGSRVSDMITNVDFAATLLEMCGANPSALPEQQGRSFLPQLRGETNPGWRQSVYYRYWEHDDPEHHAPAHYGVRTQRYKYIHYYNDGLGTPGSSDRVMPVEDELYDLAADPHELTNVAADPAYAGVLEEMTALTAQLQADYGDAPYEGPDTPRLEWPTCVCGPACPIAWAWCAWSRGPGVPGHVVVAFPVRGRRVLGLVAWRSRPGGPDIPGRVALTCPIAWP